MRVEKVVNPPRNPTPSTEAMSFDSSEIDPKASTAPKVAAPIRFTVKVPKGK